MKSKYAAIIAPICTAAAIVYSIHDAMKEVVRATPLERQNGPTQKKLIAMEVALQNAREHLDEFRKLYDETLA